MVDFLNSPAIGGWNWGDVLIGLPAAVFLVLMVLAVIGALIGFALCEPHRRETWDRPLPPKERKP
jgi:hypothetical protein